MAAGVLAASPAAAKAAAPAASPAPTASTTPIVSPAPTATTTPAAGTAPVAGTVPGAAKPSKAARPTPFKFPSNWKFACGANPGKTVCTLIKNTAVHPSAKTVARTATPDAVPAGNGYGPSQLQAAYNLTTASAADGAGATVAVVDPGTDATAASDLAEYRSAAGLPALATGQFNVFNQEGETSPLPTSDDTTEESLDIEMASAICPLCKIDLVEADPANNGLLDAELTAATTLGAKYISNSWGLSPVSDPATLDSEFFSQPGVTYVAASGDIGFNAGLTYPASSRNVISVGGTTLTPSSNSRGWTEAAWSGTGSGCVPAEPRPAWQSAVSAIAGACSGRAGNDVSAVADPGTSAAVFAGGSWFGVGGTSVATPIIAATFALAGNNGNGSAGNTAESLYDNTGGLNEVTGGSNGTCSPSVLCTATGAPDSWNGPTGWGTPDGLTSFKSLSADGTVSATNPGSQDTKQGATVSLQISAADSTSGQTLAYSATGLPAGLSISSSTGLISGKPATVGASNVSVIATDGAGASRTVSFPWTIEFPVSGALSPASVQIQPGQTAKTTLALSSTGNAESVNWSAAAPAGVSISPSSGTLSVPADGSANVSLTVTGGTDGSYTIPVTFTSSGAVPPVQLGVIVDKPGDLSPFYNVTGIASDGTTNTANFDGNGFSYSEQALAAAGITAGGTFVSGGVTYTWPSAAPNTPDAISPAGQTIPFAAKAGATEIGFVGSAVQAGTSPSTATVTVTYTDGSTSTGTLTLTDWALGGGSGPVAPGDTVVASMSHQDTGSGGTRPLTTDLFSTSIPVNGAKTVASIKLPSTVNNGAIGIFDMALGAPGSLVPLYNLTGIASDGTANTGNFDGFDSYSEQALAAAGITAGGTFVSGGLTYTWPSAAPGTPDAISLHGQTIPFAAKAGATAVGFVGSAVNAGTSPSTATVTVTYTDGTTSTGTLTMTDWALGGGGGPVAAGDTVVASTPYEDTQSGGTRQLKTDLFSTTIPVNGTKTVASITLPSTVSNGAIGIFAVTLGLPSVSVGLSSLDNLTGIVSDGATGTSADYDHDGNGYSEQALAAAGITAGGTFASGGLTYTWPSAAVATPDAISVDGQTVPFAAKAGATEIGFVGSAVEAGMSPSTGTVTVTYTDGTTSAGTLTMTDWALGGGGGPVAAGDTVVASMPYRDMGSAPAQTPAFLFSTTIPVNSAKTVASITLPSTVNNGAIGIFAISIG